ncbi:hypothetical protein H0E87_012497 [Populus deltoides]|uniref:Late embryogenesis abundant protein LEA-2 subgroup domain-containing protein n=1 Tax=Populus deltoides TaxID=3696 RepID=A0A8T2YJC2_POPDE|nr:hypothetical protein H0E87_012497 [Populus deltoides]
MTSMAPSSPRSPKRPVLYYVQSPSRDSHDGDKSSSMQTTPAYASPMESPSHLSYGRHSLSSSASRVSGGGYGWKGRSKSKGWPQSKCDDVIEEEGDYDPYGNGVSRRWLCQVLIWASGFVSALCVFCFIIWGASRPFKPQITVKSLTVHNFYFGEGSDMTGVPTKMLTVSCSVKMNVYNSATFFGIHVSSIPVNLMYSELTVATGELKRYFQPRKSHRTVSVNLKGTKVPLYGAGAGLAASEDNGGIPMTLVFEVRSIGNVVGKLVKPRHRRRVACSLAIDSRSSKAIKFQEDSCTYH